MIRNMDSVALAKITNVFNSECWAKGDLPQEWKLAKIIMIPKPKKNPSIDTLRPVSLTSCLGKLYERVIHSRLQRYLEERSWFPDSMIGFRTGLSCQDAFLLLRHEILTDIPYGDERLVLALDLKGAFDNVSHAAILEELELAGCGERTYNYLRAFLSNREASISIGQITSELFKMPNKGTPQGAIISPLLFNMVMCRLARYLDGIPDLGYTLYADDITLWTSRGSLGDKEYTLQSAVLAVEKFSRWSGLKCAPEKSEVIRIHAKGYKSRGSINIVVEGQSVREVPTMRVLGLWLQSDGRAVQTLKTLKSTTHNIAQMIRRVTYRKVGMREDDTLRLVQALVVSRITYGLPYQILNREEERQANTIIRTAFKAALGLPKCTSTERMLALGVHNTFDELRQATLMRQRERLSFTKTGRAILARLNIPAYPIYLTEQAVPLPPSVRSKITVAPIPKNMHPEYNKGRRKARAQHIQSTYSNNLRYNTYYTDAAVYAEATGQRYQRRYALAVVNAICQQQITASATAGSPTSAEILAVAIALAHAERSQRDSVVVTDSQETCRMFLKGHVTAASLAIIPKSFNHHHRLLWCPGHVGVQGNEKANALARGFTNRATPSSSNPNHSHYPSQNSTNLNAKDILAHQRGVRRKYPPPHPQLSGEEAADWRKIQTGVFPHLKLLNAMYPTRYRANCPWCGGIPTLIHITWECAKHPHRTNTSSAMEQWEAQLARSDLAGQKSLISQVRQAAEASGALD